MRIREILRKVFSGRWMHAIDGVNREAAAGEQPGRVRREARERSAAPAGFPWAEGLCA